MLNDNDRRALTEIAAFARENGDDEIANDCEIALRGDREALQCVRFDCERRSDYAQWAPEGCGSEDTSAYVNYGDPCGGVRND